VQLSEKKKKQTNKICVSDNFRDGAESQYPLVPTRIIITATGGTGRKQKTQDSVALDSA